VWSVRRLGLRLEDAGRCPSPVSPALNLDHIVFHVALECIENIKSTVDRKVIVTNVENLGSVYDEQGLLENSLMH
jgi:hypothetical protein